MYVVFAVRPESLYVVEVDVPTCVPFLYILYPVIAMLRNVEGDIELSVSARFDQSARLSLTGFLPKVGK